MLILCRRVGEEVVIEGGRIRVRVVGFTSTGQVRLSFDADPSISINRREVQDLIDAEKETD